MFLNNLLLPVVLIAAVLAIMLAQIMPAIHCIVATDGSAICGFKASGLFAMLFNSNQQVLDASPLTA